MPTLTGLIVVGGLALFSAVRNLLISQFDHALLTKVRTLTSFPEPGRIGINLGFTEKPLPEFHGGRHAEFFQVWLSDGSVLAKSPALGPNQELIRKIGLQNQPLFWSLRLPDGRPGRAVGLRLHSKDESISGSFVVDLVLARESVQLSGLLRGLAMGITISGAALLTLAWWGVRNATAAALKPVDRLAREVALIDATSLKTRIQLDSLPNELLPIAVQINHLMHRLEAAFDRERRFASNSAHELLTPVSELRIAAENAIDWPDDPQASAVLAVEARDLAVQMEHIVRSLLALSRAEASLTPLKLESTNLSVLIAELVESAKGNLPGRHLRVTCDVPEGLKVTTDPVILRSILSNLLLNACEYSVDGPSSAALTVTGRPIPTGFEITVANHVEGISSEQVEHFCEPFWRRDEAHQSREHTGLGLALCKAFAQLLDADLTIHLKGGNTVVAVFRTRGRAIHG